MLLPFHLPLSTTHTSHDELVPSPPQPPPSSDSIIEQQGVLRIPPTHLDLLTTPSSAPRSKETNFFDGLQSRSEPLAHLGINGGDDTHQHLPRSIYPHIDHVLPKLPLRHRCIYSPKEVGLHSQSTVEDERELSFRPLGSIYYPDLYEATGLDMIYETTHEPRLQDVTRQALEYEFDSSSCWLSKLTQTKWVSNHDL